LPTPLVDGLFIKPGTCENEIMLMSEIQTARLSLVRVDLRFKVLSDFIRCSLNAKPDNLF
jgi:hypothetical protein